MSDTFVVPDIHGNWRLMRGLLEQEGIVEVDDDHIYRQPGPQVVQLGDLCNCVLGSVNDDLNAIRFAEAMVDIMLVGNHEHPYFGGPRFSGFASFPELRNELLRLNDRGFIQAALEVDGILLTHAGMTCDFDEVDTWHQEDGNTAAETAEALNELWLTKQFDHGMFSCIGHTRGGAHKYGSILWSDWSEPKTKQFPQIFGHTVSDSWRARPPENEDEPYFILDPSNNGTPRFWAQTLCIDIGAGKNSSKILGAWIRDGEVKIVEYNQTS